MAETNSSDSLRNCIIVIELHDAATDSLLLWHGLDAENGKYAQGKNILVNAISFGDDLTPQGKTVKTYLWNQGHDQMVLEKISYYTTKKSPVLTGLYEPLN